MYDNSSGWVLPNFLASPNLAQDSRRKKEKGFSYLGEKSEAIFGKDFSN
ncbi:hypothetical protein [Microcoleus vaginatus]